MKNSKLHKSLAALMIGGILVGSAGTANVFAKQVSSNAKINVMQKNQKNTQDKASLESNIKAQLDKLVAAGTITQAQADEVLSKFKAQEAERQAEMEKVKNMTEAERKTYLESKTKENKSDILADLVTAGSITQAQSDAMKSIFGKGRGGAGMLDNKVKKDPATMESDMKTKLDSLVTAGTITQDQEDKIIANSKEQQAQRQAEMEKVKNMTEAERKTYLDSKVKEDRSEPYADLVSAGTITQDQANAIKNLFGNGHDKQGKIGDRGPKDPAAMESDITTKLSSLVTAGTINQEQADKIVASLKEQQAQRQAEMEKVKSMTEAERKAYFDSNVKQTKVEPFANLVSSGVISQAQADAIKNVIRNH